MTTLRPLVLILAFLLALPASPADLRPIPGERSYTDELDAAIRQAEGGVLTIHPGRYTIGTIDIDEDVTIIGYGATLVVREDWTNPGRMAVTLSARVRIEGLTIVAGGSYAAISVEYPGCRLTDVYFYDYSYKGIRIGYRDDEGDFLAERCYAESDRGTGKPKLGQPFIYPLAYQADGGKGEGMGRVEFRDCVAGPHPNSVQAGPSIKIATTRVAVVSGFRVVGEIDPANAHSLIVGEQVGRLTVTGSELPRGIVHYPDPGSDAPDVGYMLVADTDLGGDDSPDSLHYHLRAERLVYRDVRARIGRLGIMDETPGTPTRRFDGVHFTGGEQVYWPKPDITPTITATDTTRDGPIWSSRGDVARQFEGAE